jgi:hypothetical protein
MIINDKCQFNTLLAKAAAALDIPDHIYEDATLKYEDVGEWLSAEDSALREFSPEIYVQGSFRLGTVIRPITNEDEYDIDLVCHLNIRKESVTQAELKKMVGDRLRKRDDLAKMLKPSRRCWTLEYPPQVEMPGFHMDVLPAIPNSERPPTGILLTDTELRLWQRSNPKSYADWFHARMKVIFEARRAVLAKEFSASIEDVPEWAVKTPLQIAIQLLKRHRDIHFQGKAIPRPVSIIITTLAARAYSGEVDVSDALANIVRTVEANWGKPGYVENRNGRWWVENPVDPGENFADKWNEYPERREAFWAWLQKVKLDFASAQGKRLLNEAADTLSPVLGKRTMASAAREVGATDAPMLPVVTRSSLSVPGLGDSRHAQRPLWPVVTAHTASIRGDVYYARESKRKMWAMNNRPVPKNVWLRFTVQTNTPLPYAVKWQIVNTGAEAFSAGQPRGDFYDTDEGYTRTRWESTAYSGTHWVEAFVIKDGRSVARTGKLLVKVR